MLLVSNVVYKALLMADELVSCIRNGVSLPGMWSVSYLGNILDADWGGDSSVMYRLGVKL